MAFNPQFKINQMAKDMGLKSKELTDLLAANGVSDVKSFAIWLILNCGLNAILPPQSELVLRKNDMSALVGYSRREMLGESSPESLVGNAHRSDKSAFADSASQIFHRDSGEVQRNAVIGAFRC